MANAVTFVFKGGREIEAALAKLGSASTRQRVAKAGLATAGEPMRARAEALAPKLTGELGASIEIGSTATRNRNRDRDRDVVERFVGINYKGKKDLAMVAALDEFGGEHQPAQPYMRPAFEETKQQVVDRIADAVWPEIEAAAARLAKRRARG